MEFRRVWAAEPVRAIAIYSSSPEKKIVGLVEVKSVEVDSLTALWEFNGQLGGGLTRAELRSYFAGKKVGYAVLLGERFIPSQPIAPTKLTSPFRAPQSFRYLTEPELKRIARSMNT